MNEFNKLVETFDKLNIKDKRTQINEELKELLAICTMLINEKGITDMPLLHENMNDKLELEDDFLNSTYSYIISIKENIGRYFN
jgi:hypothetical protein